MIEDTGDPLNPASAAYAPYGPAVLRPQDDAQLLSARQYLACQALQGILASGAIRLGLDGPQRCRAIIVREAVALADDLIAELNKPVAASVREDDGQPE